MTFDEALDCLSMVRLWWPNADIDGGDPKKTAATWLQALQRYDASEVEATLVRERDSGRDWPPKAGGVVNAVERERQGEAPSFEDACEAMWRALPQRVFLRTLYDPEGRYSPESTARAVALMQAGGAHEAVLRLVQDRGLRAIVTLPHGDRHPLDRNQAADHRDMARHYRDSTVQGWRENPRPGLALERACRTVELDAGEVLQLAEGERRALTAPRPLALPPGTEPEEEGATVPFSPAEAMRVWTAERAAARGRDDAARAAVRDRERAAREAAEVELAEHAQQRDKSSR